jgi:transposase
VQDNLPINGHTFRRVEVMTGSPRRRRWSDAQKAAIVAESQAPGAEASEIALRYGLHRNQLYGWRRQFRAGAIGEVGNSEPAFVPIVAETCANSGAAPIEIEVGGAIVRLGDAVNIAVLGKVLRLLKALR